jgi:hypothetical protein
MTDEAEQSIPSRGSHGDEYEFPGGPLFSERFKMAHAAFEWCRDNNASLSAPVNIVTALFSLGLVVKKPTLTDEERDALRHAEEATAGMLHVYTDERPGFDISEKLRGLRERLG